MLAESALEILVHTAEVRQQLASLRSLGRHGRLKQRIPELDIKTKSRRRT
jgi:hypothetical protein